jgi:hypothetical protein
MLEKYPSTTQLRKLLILSLSIILVHYLIWSKGFAPEPFVSGDQAHSPVPGFRGLFALLNMGVRGRAASLRDKAPRREYAAEYEAPMHTLVHGGACYWVRRHAKPGRY